MGLAGQTVGSTRWLDGLSALLFGVFVVRVGQIDGRIVLSDALLLEGVLEVKSTCVPSMAEVKQNTVGDTES